MVALHAQEGCEHIIFSLTIGMPDGKEIYSFNVLDGGADMQALQRITNEIMENIK